MPVVYREKTINLCIYVYLGVDGHPVLIVLASALVGVGLEGVDGGVVKLIFDDIFFDSLDDEVVIVLKLLFGVLEGALALDGH